MLISNWLSSLVSRIRLRPRYNSRARRAIRKRWQMVHQNRPAVIELLEDRTLLTTLSIADVDIVEGDNGTQTLYFYANLSEAVGADITFSASTSDITASASGGDYTALSTQSFTITTGNTSAAIAIDIAGDTTVELDETFQLTLSNLNDGGQGVTFAGAGSTESATGTITADDSFVQIIDDGDTGFSMAGSWGHVGGGYSGDHRYKSVGTGTGANTASWEFSNLSAGTYRVSSNWYISSSSYESIQHTISGITGGDVTVSINQKAVATDVFDQGVYWEDLGFFEVDANGTITVTVSDLGITSGIVYADAMRLEAIPVGVTEPEIKVTQSTTNLN
ncbi:MAG: hypothetical protein KDA74_17045, partial [Planctomycetaceae bacterium]|nr:hypothetical protein [Planctomycetaceae bacterium]